MNTSRPGVPSQPSRGNTAHTTSLSVVPVATDTLKTLIVLQQRNQSSQLSFTRDLLFIIVEIPVAPGLRAGGQPGMPLSGSSPLGPRLDGDLEGQEKEDRQPASVL